jgi:cytochrome P450
MLTILAERTPASTLDPYTDRALLNPWPLYRELREMGPAVWLEKYAMFALTRYDVVVKALRDWEAFPSSFGVMMNDDMNQVLRGNTLCSDGDAHNQLRRVVMRPLTPVAIKSLQTRSSARLKGSSAGCAPGGDSAQPGSSQLICR